MSSFDFVPPSYGKQVSTAWPYSEQAGVQAHIDHMIVNDILAALGVPVDTDPNVGGTVRSVYE